MVAVAILGSRFVAIRESHPAYLATLIVVILAATLVAARQVLERTTRQPPGSEQPSGSSRLRIVAQILSLVGVVVLTGALWYLRPLPASEVAARAMAGAPGVEVADSATRIQMRPQHGTSSTGLVFYPGALVEPRSYVPILTPLAESGFPVVIVKLPYNLGFFDPDGAIAVMDAEPEVTRWVVAGHSLGGVFASSVAGRDDRAGGLLLWASFPNSAVPARDTLLVSSIFGSNDALATPAKIDDSRARLPENTDYVEIAGGIHSFFGDYGLQSGDGEPTITRDDAQRQIADASIALLNTVDDMP